VKFRRFTPAGIAATRDYLAKAKAAAALDLPARDALIASPALTESIPALADLDFDPTRTFDTTFAFCEYFHSLMKDHKPLAYRTDVGFWTWLAMVYVKQLVKKDAEGRIDCGMEGRILFAGSDYKREYRHLLAAPYYAFLNYADNWQTCAAVLVQPINAPGDFVDQILTRRVFLQNPCLMKTLSRLYLSNDGRKLRRGATSQVRRFISYVDQIARTRDFYQIEDVPELLALLPANFH